MVRAKSTEVAKRKKESKRNKGAGRPVDGDSEKTRRLIIDAARTCFGRRGYRQTSNRQIADEAGLTTGTIYHHFANKQDMFVEVYKETQAVIFSYTAPVMEEERFEDAFIRMIDVFTELHQDHPSFIEFNAAVRGEARRNPELGPAVTDRQWRQLFQRLSELAISTGETHHRDARELRLVLATILLGMTQHGVEVAVADQLEALNGIKKLVTGDLLKRSE